MRFSITAEAAAIGYSWDALCERAASVSYIQDMIYRYQYLLKLTKTDCGLRPVLIDALTMLNAMASAAIKTGL